MKPTITHEDKVQGKEEGKYGFWFYAWSAIQLVYHVVKIAVSLVLLVVNTAWLVVGICAGALAWFVTRK